jgi:tryptophan synthase beta chain
MSKVKIYLEEKDMPRAWYNIQADMPNQPQPPLHPGTKKPVGPDDLSPIFPMGLIAQEMATER